MRLNWRAALFAAGTVAVLIAFEHLFTRGWTEGFIDGLLVAAMVAALGLVFLLSAGGAMLLGGAWGEEATRETLKTAQKEGHIWGAVHNIELGKADIDHIVVAPSGVYALETKWRFVDHTPAVLSDFAAQASRNARKAASVLRSQTVRTPHDVVPLVVMWSKGQHGLPDDGVVVDGVLVLAGGDLPQWLSRQATGRMAQDNAELLLERLSAFAMARPMCRRRLKTDPVSTPEN
ncbi:MAG: nuclease-related domain-containing protein [Mycobacteriales bacterium]